MTRPATRAGTLGAAAWMAHPMTQIQPLSMMHFLRPIRSDSHELMSAPPKDPAGIAAVMPPCRSESGFLNWRR